MVRYSNREQAEMIFMYGRANGNGKEAARMYHERYPERQVPSATTFMSMYRRLCETGTFNPVPVDRGMRKLDCRSDSSSEESDEDVCEIVKNLKPKTYNLRKRSIDVVDKNPPSTLKVGEKDFHGTGGTDNKNTDNKNTDNKKVQNEHPKELCQQETMGKHIIFLKAPNTSRFMEEEDFHDTSGTDNSKVQHNHSKEPFQQETERTNFILVNAPSTLRFMGQEGFHGTSGTNNFKVQYNHPKEPFQQETERTKFILVNVPSTLRFIGQEGFHGTSGSNYIQYKHPKELLQQETEIKDFILGL